MKKLVAIGGGEIGRPGFPVETTDIDKEIIKLSGEKNPKLLFIPTASSDAVGYVQTVEKHFGKDLGCQIDVLYLIKEKPSYEEIENKVFDADIVYVGGGDTLKMLRIWRKNKLDKILISAYEKGVILSGLSAGSICWFKYGNSDSKKFTDPSSDLIRVRGLGLINALHCPHYDVEAYREADLKKMMKRTRGVSIAMDNCCALEIIDDRYRIITSKPSAKAYRVYWRNGQYHKEIIPKETGFRSLNMLLDKKISPGG